MSSGFKSGFLAPDLLEIVLEPGDDDLGGVVAIPHESHLARVISSLLPLLRLLLNFVQDRTDRHQSAKRTLASRSLTQAKRF